MNYSKSLGRSLPVWAFTAGPLPSSLKTANLLILLHSHKLSHHAFQGTTTCGCLGAHQILPPIVFLFFLPHRQGLMERRSCDSWWFVFVCLCFRVFTQFCCRRHGFWFFCIVPLSVFMWEFITTIFQTSLD